METLEAFVIQASKFSKQYDDAALGAMRTHLSILSRCSDTTVFDPDSGAATKFYVSLHEALRCLAGGPPHGRTVDTVVAAMGALSRACRNEAARRALTHTHRFADVLGRFLAPPRANALPHQAKAALLDALQELSYGISITWREAHLPGLLKSLTSWVAAGAPSSADDESRALVAPSLGVLVNLCYRNLPAVVMLMRSVDSKAFLRTAIRLQDRSPATRLQVSKLVLTLKQISGDIPDADILEFCSVTFAAVGDALSNTDAFLLRQIVDFFNDVRANDKYRNVILRYSSFRRDTERLLRDLLDSSKPQCVSMLLEFLLALVQLNLQDLLPLYKDFSALALRWVAGETVSTAALAVLGAVVSAVCGGDHLDQEQAEWHGDGKKKGHRADQDLQATLDQAKEAVLKQLEYRISTLAMILQLRSTAAPDTPEGDKVERIPLTDTETRRRMATLLRLLKEMERASPELREQVMLSVSHESVVALFKPLLSAQREESLFQEEVAMLYVQALELMNELAQHSGDWRAAFAATARRPQVQLVVGVALLTAPHPVKRQVLRLMAAPGFLDDYGGLVCEALCELQPLLVAPWRGGGGGGGGAGGGVSVPRMDAAMQHDMTPLFTIAQEGRLDQMMARLQEAFDNNQISDVSLSAVVDLYQCKVAALGNAERGLYARLEKANEDVTRYEQQLAQTLAGASRLLQRFRHNQEFFEAAQRRLRDQEDLLNEEKEAKSSLEKELETKTFEVEAMRRQFESVQMRKEQLAKQAALKASDSKTIEHKLKEQITKNGEQAKAIRQLQDKLTKKKEAIEKMEGELSVERETARCRDAEMTRLQAELGVSRKEATLLRTSLKAREDELRELRELREEITRLSSRGINKE